MLTSVVSECAVVLRGLWGFGEYCGNLDCCFAQSWNVRSLESTSGGRKLGGGRDMVECEPEAEEFG
jgi:hypothetical protein